MIRCGDLWLDYLVFSSDEENHTTLDHYRSVAQISADLEVLSKMQALRLGEQE